MASTSADLIDAIDAGDATRVREILARFPELATMRDDAGVSVLLHARYRSDRDVTDAIRAHRPELDGFEAAAFGDTTRLADLLAGDASLATARSADGFTALHLAAFFGKADAARLLLERGVEADARGEGWMVGTALHSAVSGRHPEVVDLLLAAHADPNARQALGWTPLHGAVHNGDVASTRSLLAAGADPRSVNDEGRSVEALAAEHGDAATIALIRAAVER
jgi:ankyrin repeat protein